MRRLILCLALSLGGFALASPSAFPENAVYFSVGYGHALTGIVGGEWLISTPYLDTSLDLALHGNLDGEFGVRLSGTALAFPALGTDPPLALGLGADIGVSSEETAFHLGLVLGTDLLFVFDLPMTASSYLAPGYSTASGFSFAWALQVRYYFDTFAVEVASSDLALVSVGARYLF